MISKLKFLFLLVAFVHGTKRTRDEMELISNENSKRKMLRFTDPEKIERDASTHHVDSLVSPEVIETALALNRPLTDADLLFYYISTERFDQINKLLNDKKRFPKLSQEHYDALKVKDLAKFLQNSPSLLSYPQVHQLLALKMSVTHNFDEITPFKDNMRGAVANLNVYKMVFQSPALYCNLLLTILQLGNEGLRTKNDFLILDRVAFELMKTTKTSPEAIKALIDCDWDPLSMPHIARIFRFAVKLNVPEVYDHFLNSKMVQPTQIFMHGIFQGNMMVLVEGRLELLKRFLAFGVSVNETISSQVDKLGNYHDLSECFSITTLAYLWSDADEEMKSFLMQQQSYTTPTLELAQIDAQKYHFEDLHSFCKLHLTDS